MSTKEVCTVRCSLTIAFRSAAEAETVHRSVELDNDGYLETKVEGQTVVARIEADSLKSLLHTLDDFLACLGVADKIVSKKD
ncbi:MAG TPA: hypothetical protein HA364_04245 [Thermoplasmata archaeon]|nr:hypothetical protein [Thermoplasmata archaeon]